MTRPLFEPTTQRALSTQGWGQRQLFRRPAPQAGTGTPIEWIAMSSLTNWGTSLTALDFSETAGSYDQVTPTFAINGDNNLEINKAGDYTIDCLYLGSASDGSGTTWAHVDIEIQRVSGPTPVGIHAWVAGVGQPALKLGVVPAEPLNADAGYPHFHDFVHWDDGDFVGTPTEFELQAVRYIDGVETIWNEAVVEVLVVRLGDPFPLP